MKKYNINREAAKMPAVSSCKIYKYEYCTGEEDYLPIKAKVNQSIEQTKFTYPPLGKIFENEKKN